MWKIILATLLLLGLTIPTTAVEPIGISFKGFSLELPFQEVSTVYVFDMISETSMVGAETVVSRLFDDRLQITVGGVTSVDSELKSESGIPFIGFDIQSSALFAERFHFGGFFGRDTTKRENIVGVKSSIRLW